MRRPGRGLTRRPKVQDQPTHASRSRAPPRSSRRSTVGSSHSPRSRLAPKKPANRKNRCASGGRRAARSARRSSRSSGRARPTGRACAATGGRRRRAASAAGSTLRRRRRSPRRSARRRPQTPSAPSTRTRRASASRARRRCLGRRRARCPPATHAPTTSPRPFAPSGLRGQWGRARGTSRVSCAPGLKSRLGTGQDWGNRRALLRQSLINLSNHHCWPGKD